MAQHFYTVSKMERDALLQRPGVTDEGIACYVRYTTPYYRFRNERTQDYFYTTSPFQTPDSWGIGPPPDFTGLPYTPEGVACEVLPLPLTYAPPDSVQIAQLPVYRRFKPASGGHLYFIETDAGSSDMSAADAAGYDKATVDCGVPEEQLDPTLVPFYRFYSPAVDSHLYTTSKNEGDEAPGYHFEKIAWKVIAPPYTTPVFRLYNKASGAHLYTIDPVEATKSVSDQGYVFERLECGIFQQPQPNTTPLFRLHNAAAYDYLYTTSTDERIKAAAAGYKTEGITGEVYPTTTPNAPYSTPLYRLLIP